MGNYTRLGSYLLASELTSDPFGSIHRAIATVGSNFDRHLLARTFSDEISQAGMNTRLTEVSRVVPQLGGARIFGMGYRVEGGKPPHLLWDYMPGRSLAQLIEKAKKEQIPLGVDHALTVIQGVAQGIVQMQAKDLSHGLLSPHSVWVSFEGATQIVDAPCASLVKGMLAKAPTLQQKLAPYLMGHGGTGPDALLQQDLFSLGAMLYELLTFERLPVGGDLSYALERATLKAAQEDAPLPPEIRAFLGRLLLGRQPFARVEAFNAELERVLYDGDYSPTTFNMAFFMHTLFREENDRDAAAIKAEQGDNYLAYTAAGESLRSGAVRLEPLEDHSEGRDGQKNRILLIGGGLAAAVLLVFGYLLFGRAPAMDPAMKQQLADLKQLKEQIEQQKKDLEAMTRAESEKTAQLQKQLGESKSAEDRAKLQKQLEEAEKRKQDLERQQRENDQGLAAEKAAEERLAEQRKAAQSKLAALLPQPAPEAPKPQPMQEEPKPVVPSATTTPGNAIPTPGAAPTPPPLAIPTHSLSAPPPASGAINEPATWVRLETPAPPTRAKQMRWELHKDHFVKLKVFVGEQGQPMKVMIVKGVPGSFGFDESAIEAANKSTYKPAMRDGKPVRAWTNDITYKFPKR